MHTNSNFKLLYLEEEKNLAICFLGLEYFAQRFNRSRDKNGQKKIDRLFDLLGQIFGQILGLWGGSRGLFLAQMFPSIANSSLKISSVSTYRKKFPHTETKANLDQNRH